MNPGTSPPDQPMLLVQKLLDAVAGELPDTALEIRREGNTIASVGTLPARTTAFRMDEYELIVGRGPEEIAIIDRATVVSAGTLVKTLLPNIVREEGKPGRISMAGLFRSLLHVLRALESRSTYLEYYEKILHLNQRILMAGELSTVLQIIMDQAKEGTGGEAASLLLVDLRTNEMYFNIVSGEKGDDLREIRIPAGRGIAGSIVMSGKAEIIPDVAVDPRAYAEVDKKIGSITRNMSVAPITARGQVIGVIEVINSLSGTGFTQAKLEFLINIASHTGLLIENARNVQDLVRSNRLLDRKISELNGLHEIGRAISATLDHDELKRSLLRTLMKIMRVGSGGILEMRPGGRIATQTYGLTIGDSGINENADQINYQEVTDIALWMKENREPFYFGADPASETAGLSNRFRRDNADIFKATGGPDLWLPVFEVEGGAVAFVLALGDLTLRRRNPVDDLAFFRGVMTLAQSGYRNVQLYGNALQSRDKEETIRKSFQKYVPARVVHEVIEQTESPKPRQQKVSILFADIRNFTRLAESMDPALLLELLNEFFEEMVDAVAHRNGIVDKFMGDALMALFGVPNAEEDDAANALLAAQDMIARLQALNRRRLASHRALFEMGMGLHTGSAIIGNIGASQRLDYTAVGDAVNLAARLERLTKYYHSPLLFTEDTLRESNQTMPHREVDLIQVRGRVAQSRIFELVNPEMEPNQADWAEALATYRNAHFRDALTIFERLAGGGDQVSAIYAERSRQFIQNPPPGDWQAVFKLDI